MYTAGVDLSTTATGWIAQIDTARIAISRIATPEISFAGIHSSEISADLIAASRIAAVCVATAQIATAWINITRIAIIQYWLDHDTSTLQSYFPFISYQSPWCASPHQISK